MDIQNEAVQSFLKVAMPWFTPERQAATPNLTPMIIGMLYFHPDCPFEVKVALQVPQHPSELRNRADRQRSMAMTLEAERLKREADAYDKRTN